MPNVSVVFDADTGRFVSNVDSAEKSVIKASEAVAAAKNRILDWGKTQIEQAQAAGRSFEQLERIQTQTAQRLANVTETNATRVISAMDRQQAKARALAAELQNVNRVAAVTRAAEVLERHNPLEGITQRQQASAIIRAGSGTMSVRAAESFATLLPGFAPFASVAFPIVGAIAFTAEIVKGVGALREMQAEQEKLREAQESFGVSAQKSFGSYREQLLEAGMRADELRGNHVAALQKQLELINLQGFDQLSSAFEALDKNVSVVFQSIKTGWLDTVSAITSAGNNFNGAVGTTGVDASRNRFGTQYQSLLAQGQGDQAQRLLNSTQQWEERTYALMDQVIKHRANLSGTATPWAAIDELRQRHVNVDSISDFRKQYEAQQTFVKELEDQQKIAGYQRQLTAMNRSNAVISVNRISGNPDKDASENILNGLRQLFEAGRASGRIQTPADIQEFWANSTGHRSLSGAPISPNQYVQDAVQKEYNTATVELNKQLKEADTALTKWSLALDQEGVKKLQQEAAERLRLQREAHDQYLKQQKSTLDDQLGSTRLSFERGYIGSRDAVRQELSAYLRYGSNTGLDRLDTPEGAQLRSRIAQLEEQLEPPIEKLFDSIRRNAQDTADKIEKITEQFIDSINDNVVHSMFGERTNWSGTFRAAGESVAKTGLQRLEGSIFGTGKKGDGYHVWVDNAGTGVPGVGGAIPAVPGIPGVRTGSSILSSGLLGMLNDSNWASSLFGGRLFGSGGFFGAGGGFASLFGGGRAVGGGVNAGTTYLIGEKGPELFRPSTSGNIVPNHALTGGSPSYTIDARGTDPVQTQMAVQRAMQATHAQSVRDASHAIAERSRRTPR